MFISIKNKINKNSLIISDKKKNNVINDSYFYRLYYSNENFISNGIVVSCNFFFINCENFFKKIKLNFKEKDNIENVNKIIELEQNLLYFFNSKKKAKYSLKDNLKQGFIKIQNIEQNIVNELKQKKQDIVLKISGFWETKYEVGLTYRFFICEKV